MYILFTSDSFAFQLPTWIGWPFDLVMISKSQWRIGHPDPICISTSSLLGFVSAAETEYLKSLSSGPLTTSVLFGLLGTKALLGSKGLLGSGQPARVMVGNCKTWSTSGHQGHRKPII